MPGAGRTLHIVRLIIARRLWRIEVVGNSMLPTLSPGQIVWCETRPRISNLRVGDIIVFRDSDVGSTRRHVYKRDGSVLETTEEDWTSIPGELEIKRLSVLSGGQGSTLPPSHCEVLGDNADHSADSRKFGPVPLAAIAARVILLPEPSVRRAARPRRTESAPRKRASGCATETETHAGAQPALRAPALAFLPECDQHLDVSSNDQTSSGNDHETEQRRGSSGRHDYDGYLTARVLTLGAFAAATLALFFAPALMGTIGIGLGALAWFRGDRFGCVAAVAALAAMIAGALVSGQILQGIYIPANTH